MNDFTIGILSPTRPEEFRDFLPVHYFERDIPHGLGGAPINLMVRELLKRGRRVIIFSLDPTIADESVLEGDRLKICIGPYTRHRARAYFKPERHYLLQAVLRERPDVLNAHWTYEFALAAIASGIPHVVTAHDAPWRILRRDFKPYRMVRTVMAYHASRLSRRMIADSPATAEHLRRFGFHSSPIEVIPNGLPSELFQRDIGPKPGDPITFASIFSGGWQGLRNGATAIKAFALVRRQLGKGRLLAIGDQCQPDGPAAAWARQQGLDDGIDFRGRLPHGTLLDVLAQEVDVLVHPALEESFGMPLIEAGTLGVPAIAGRLIGGIPWVLGEGAYGVLVDVRSPRAIASAMLRLATEPEARRELGSRARHSMRDRFDIRRITDRYEEIFKALAGPPAFSSVDG